MDLEKLKDEVELAPDSLVDDPCILAVPLAVLVLCLYVVELDHEVVAAEYRCGLDAPLEVVAVRFDIAEAVHQLGLVELASAWQAVTVSSSFGLDTLLPRTSELDLKPVCVIEVVVAAA